jgi:hypothetical protein
MVFIQTLNKFCIVIENTKDIQFINSICNQQPPNNFVISYLFYTNKLVQKHNANVLLTHQISRLFSKQWTSTINHAHHLTNFQMI